MLNQAFSCKIWMDVRKIKKLNILLESTNRGKDKVGEGKI